VVYDDHESEEEEEEEEDMVSEEEEEEDGDAEETQDSEDDEEDEMEEDDDDSDYPEEMEDDDDDASYCTESSFRSHSTYSSTPGTHPAGPGRAAAHSSSPPPRSLSRSLPCAVHPKPMCVRPPPAPHSSQGDPRRHVQWQKTRFARGKRLIVQNGDCIVALCRPFARSLSLSQPKPSLSLSLSLFFLDLRRLTEFGAVQCLQAGWKLWHSSIVFVFLPLFWCGVFGVKDASCLANPCIFNVVSCGFLFYYDLAVP
jgi:hypothetical protein